jgi:hypothetical protein
VPGTAKETAEIDLQFNLNHHQAPRVTGALSMSPAFLSPYFHPSAIASIQAHHHLPIHI